MRYYMEPVSCCSYMNPCDRSFEKFTFKNLSCRQKTVTVFATAIGLAGLGIGSLVLYRLCLRTFSAHRVAPRYEKELTRLDNPVPTSRSRSEDGEQSEVKSGEVVRAIKFNDQEEVIPPEAPELEPAPEPTPARCCNCRPSCCSSQH